METTMKRKRKLAVALAWLFPVVFFAILLALDALGLLPSDRIAAITFFCLGPLAFTGFLCYMLLDRTEDRDVRYSHASRRVGNTSKLAALGTVAMGFPGLFGRAHFWSYLVGVAGFLFIAMIGLTLMAIVFRLMQRDRPEPGGARDAVIVTVVVFSLAWILLPAAARLRPPEPYRPSCANHVKQLGLVCKMFANENDGLYPELSSRPGFLSMMKMTEGYCGPIIPEYLSDPSVLFCPTSERWKSQEGKFVGAEQELLDSSSYVYLGYAIRNEDELETFYECYRERVAAGLPFNEDLSTPAGRGSGGGDRLLRLREGVEKIYVTDSANPAAITVAQSDIPFLIERLGNHEPPGVNVLYIDGHVEFIRYPGKWPATPKTFEIIAAIESLRTHNDAQPGR